MVKREAPLCCWLLLGVERQVPPPPERDPRSTSERPLWSAVRQESVIRSCSPNGPSWPIPEVGRLLMIAHRRASSQVPESTEAVSHIVLYLTLKFRLNPVRCDPSVRSQRACKGTTGGVLKSPQYQAEKYLILLSGGIMNEAGETCKTLTVPRTTGKRSSCSSCYLQDS
jgi:hypothetical protein